MSLTAEARMLTYLLELQQARATVRRYALVCTPHVDRAQLAAIVQAVGEVLSVNEAMTALDRAERRAVIHHL